MACYAAFLRGVNVGGVRLKMADVASALRSAGFDDVRTILASGNVVLTAYCDAPGVRTAAETALRGRFGYDAWVLVYEMASVRSIVDDFPFEPEVDGHHSYVTFVSDPVVLNDIAGLAAGAGPEEKIARGDGVIYWQVPRSGTLTSAIGRTMGNGRYASSTTTRNLRTLGKVLRG